MIVVLVRWGRKGSYYPDETALVTARYLASLGVSLIVGSHSLLQQDHAYFEDTLVIFSAGSFSRTSSQPQLCWQQVIPPSPSLPLSLPSSLPPSLSLSLCVVYRPVMVVVMVWSIQLVTLTAAWFSPAYAPVYCSVNNTPHSTEYSSPGTHRVR